MKVDSTTKLLIASTLSLFIMPSANAAYGDYSNGRTAADNMSDAANSGNSDTPRSLVETSGDSGDGCNSQKARSATGCQPSAEQAEAQMYGRIKDKGWDQLNSHERKYLNSIGVENPEVYGSWKEERKEIETFAKAEQQQPMYDKVKGRTWDQLSSREQQYARKNGIGNADQFNTWKETHELIMNAKKQKDELANFNRIKYKAWRDLTATEKADMRRKGVANELAFEAYKEAGQQKLLAGQMSEEEKKKQALADEEAKKAAKLAEMAAQREQQNQTEMVANQEQVFAGFTNSDQIAPATVSAKADRKPASVKRKKTVSFTRSRVAN